ncbi:MAG: potassium-transporting ATPase subunit KdpA [Deltaproteobacteria bacterium]|nr:MAG: potassium-transporting ATPase subunit KdpA [Deltaproteobacteria bacterium]
MTSNGWLQILVYGLLILAVTKPLGVYLHRVFESPERPLPRVFGPLERWSFRLCGVDPDEEQNWKEYALALLLFSLVGVAVSYLIMRAQHFLPLNPQGLGPVAPDLAFNTAVSFTTNTNWQAYGGESTMSYFSQMAALAWHNFISAAAGLGVALALARGLTRRAASGGEAPRTVGNFWGDLLRSINYVFLPVCLVSALVLVSQGVVQTFSPYPEITTLEGAKQTIPLGPVASQEVIKEFGINGGGFFNANSAHPFENPTPISNFLEMLLIFAIPAALTYTYGRMARDQKEGWVIFGAMALLFLVGVGVTYWAEARPNAALAGLPVEQTLGNLEGKEMRFGIADSSLFATITTAASCGAVNSMHDSFTPLGGLVPLVNIQLGEVIFGGVGAGLYGMLVFVILAVFIAGLMVGRTPEYLGKKIESREIKFAMLYVLIFPLIILGFAAWAAVAPYALPSLNNAGPHGLSEILYAFSSAAGNNGSAFAGLNANTPWWNIALGLAMLAGRFWMMIPVLAIAGAMVGKKTVPPTLGTFPTNGGLFPVLLVGVILIVGALTFFPVLSLGPVLEEYLARQGRLF